MDELVPALQVNMHRKPANNIHINLVWWIVQKQNETLLNKGVISRRIIMQKNDIFGCVHTYSTSK